MKISTKPVSRIAALCGAVFLTTATFANSSDAIEAEVLTDVIEIATVDIESDLDQMDPLQMTVSPLVYNGEVNIRCYGENSGRATCITTGGVAPFVYSWSHNASLTGNLAVGLVAGNYAVTVTDAAGSSVTQSYTLVQNPPFTAAVSATEILCFGGSSIVTTSGMGGTMPYGGVTSFTVTAGEYNYLLADANGCRSGASIAITQPDILTATATPTPILCFGDASHVTVSATGGTLPLTGDGIFSEVAGIYEYSITDGNGCVDNVTLAINQPGDLNTMVSFTPIECYGETSQVTVTVFSGTEPYLGTGTFTEQAGEYTYHVVDLNGCPDSVTAIIPQPAMLVPSATATQIDCNGGTAEITVSATGGTMPYSSNLGNYTVGAGNYSYTITDGNSCDEVVSITVAEPEVLSATISSTSITCNGGSSDITITATGGTAPYIGTGTISAVAGEYTFTVADANGCSVVVSTTITEPGGITVLADATGPIQCFGDNTTIVVSATGGAAPYSGVGSFSGLVGETITYTVTDANGCSASTAYTVTGGSEIIANVSPSVYTMDCTTPELTIYANPSGGIAPYTYSWSTGETTSSITVSPDEMTVYNVTITDANGCSVTTTNGSTVFVPNRCGNGNKKIMICHVPSGNLENPQTICISPNALDPHMEDLWNLHGGDYCGPCQSSMSIALDEENNGDNNFISVGMNTNNETVEISYRLAYDSDVRVEIYDMTGTLVEVIHENNAEEGQMYDVVMVPSKFTSGVYIYQFITNVERHIDKLHFIH